jgi:hypothetical protein
VTELLDGIKMAWFLGGVALLVLHEWWKRRAEHRGESAWRSKIGEELVYIWFGGIVLFSSLRYLFGEPAL